GPLQVRGVAPEAFGRTRLAPPDAVQAGPAQMQVGLQGVAGNADPVDLGTALGVALRGAGRRHVEHRGEAGERQQSDHVGSPVSLTRMTPIMPAAWCSRIWQWNIQSPGLSATKAISTCSRGAISTVSCH